MIINAQNLILGRVASFVAKQALLGKKIDIVNCGNAVIIGKKKSIFTKYKDRAAKGSPRKGPFPQRDPEKFVKRAIRGMLPYNQERGKKALKNIKCYKDVPEDLKDKEILSIEKFNVFKTQNINFTKVEQLCKLLGGK